MTPSIAERLGDVQRQLATDLNGALGECEQLVKAHPQHFDVLMMRAYLRMRARDYAGAESALLDIAAKYPDKGAVQFNLAVCCDRQGRLPEALRYYGVARHLSGNDDLPAVLAARCMHRLGRPDAAVPVLADIVKRSPGHAGARLWLIHALREAGASQASEQHARVLRQSLQADRKSLRSLISFFQENHFAGWNEVDDKSKLTAQVAALRTRLGARAFRALPDTFVMPDDKAALEAAHAAMPGPWVVKPANLHNGHGIRIITAPAQAPHEPGWVVQRYVEQTMLVHERKFSLRLFLLVTSVAPARVYLFNGGRTVFSVQPYVAGDYGDDSLPMHIAHTNVFGERVDEAFEQTKAVLEHPNAEWPYARLASYLGKAGLDPRVLWRRLRSLALDMAQLLASNGLFAAQADKAVRFAYVPKILALDVLIDEHGQPWLTEVESGPTVDGLFDGGLEQDTTFASLVDLITAPLPQTGDDVTSGAALDARQAELERRVCGRFEPLWPVESTTAATAARAD